MSFLVRLSALHCICVWFKKKVCLYTPVTLCCIGNFIKSGPKYIYAVTNTVMPIWHLRSQKSKSKQHNAAVCYMSHLIDTAFKMMAPKQGCLILLPTCCPTPLSPRLPRLRLWWQGLKTREKESRMYSLRKEKEGLVLLEGWEISGALSLPWAMFF